MYNNMIKKLKFLLLIPSVAFSTIVHGSIEDGISLMYQNKPEEALKELQKYISPAQPLKSQNSKNKTDPRASFYSAFIYLFGDNPDPKKGLPLLEQAVQQGYSPALEMYAGLYLHGEFVPQDRHKALLYFEIAARQGYGPAQFNCGILYKNGDKIPKDLGKAFIYLTLAAHNHKDLEKLTEDATHYRNEVIAAMTSEQYQKALTAFGRYK